MPSFAASISRRFTASDFWLLGLLRLCAAVAGAVLMLIVSLLLLEAWPLLAKIGPTRFFTDGDWQPAERLYDMTPMLWGTLYAVAGAMLVSTPLGLASAVFCRFYAPPTVAVYYRRMIELLAGIPSVVYGLWGLMVLVPLIGAWRLPGTSLLAGIIVLSRSAFGRTLNWRSKSTATPKPKDMRASNGYSSKWNFGTKYAIAWAPRR